MAIEMYLLRDVQWMTEPSLVSHVILTILSGEPKRSYALKDVGMGKNQYARHQVCITVS